MIVSNELLNKLQLKEVSFGCSSCGTTSSSLLRVLCFDLPYDFGKLNFFKVSCILLVFGGVYNIMFLPEPMENRQNVPLPEMQSEFGHRKRNVPRVESTYDL